MENYCLTSNLTEISCYPLACPTLPLRARQVTAMGLFFVGHIHLYGLAQYLFGDLGPVVAWPLIMSSTVRLKTTQTRCSLSSVMRGDRLKHRRRTDCLP